MNQRTNRQQHPMMNFTGYGPAGWKRTDTLIEDDICKRFYSDGALDATGIQVEVNGGNVTLTGYVPTERSRNTANQIAMHVPGVKHLNNHLDIAITASTQTPQAATGRSASRA